MSGIQPILMPKWGLAMQEGTVVQWHAEVGEEISSGQEILEIETSKIASGHESSVAGPLRRIVVQGGETVPVGALLGVVAEASVSDAELDGYVEEFLGNFEFDDGAADSGPADETVEVAGRTLQFVRQGDGAGAPILFLHGFGGDRLGWMFNQSALAESFGTIALDLPGHGGSTKDVGGGTVDDLAGAVAGFLDALSIERAHLVGHSMGGAVAIALAASSPARVGSASLLAPAGLGVEINMAFIDGFVNQTRARKLRPVLELLVANPALITADMIENVIRFKRLDGAKDALVRLKEGLFPEGRQRVFGAERLSSVGVPVQVVWGEQDRILPVGHAAAFGGSVPVTRIPEAGHLPHMEAAGAVNQAVFDFIRG